MMVAVGGRDCNPAELSASAPADVPSQRSVSGDTGMTTADVLYTLRAKHQGEAIAHCKTRRAFLRDVIADERTRTLFASWGAFYGLDEMIGIAQPILDRVAQRSGFADRSVFRTRHDGMERSLLDAVRHQADRFYLRQLLENIERRLSDTRVLRGGDMPEFIVSRLYRTPSDTAMSIRAWLGSDLLDVFDEEVACQVWGMSSRFLVPLSPVAGVVPKGFRPKHDGEHLARNAHWHYLLDVHEPPAGKPRVSQRSLARQYFGDGERKKDIKEGAARAEYFLTLPVPPEQWAGFLAIPPGGKLPPENF